MALHFEKYAQEGQHFINRLAEEFGHPEEKGRAGIVLRAVMHTLRERITMAQSLHILAQLPMALKAVYVDNWKYLDTPIRLSSREDFIGEVEMHQRQYGERDFNWNKSTEELIQVVIGALSEFISEGEYEHFTSQLPNELRMMFREMVKY
jgi:uncharacterized protein (DUF2267 family)